jgi:hypothetical protein
MKLKEITDKDRAMAQRCGTCPVCTRARKNQKGLAFWFVQMVEGSVCPYCKAYERVYGRKAHQPVPDAKKSRGLGRSGRKQAKKKGK